MKLFFLFFFGVSAVLAQSASSPKDIPTIAKESNGVAKPGCDYGEREF
jgi:hypothetical protein